MLRLTHFTSLSGVCEADTHGCGSKPMVPFWDKCTTHFRTCFSGDRDVHWGVQGSDPWPHDAVLPGHNAQGAVDTRHALAACPDQIMSLPLCPVQAVAEVPPPYELDYAGCQGGEAANPKICPLL